MTSPIDVVWLKRDVRLHDHGPFSEVNKSTNKFIVLYLYEPNQLAHDTVHGSHIHLINEGLIELDSKLSGRASNESGESVNAQKQLHAITVCYANCVETLMAIHRIHPIGRILAHEETGNYASYQRDRLVRKWCRENDVACIEYHQTGVTRRLRDRDQFSAKLSAFLNQPQYDSIVALDLVRTRSRLLTDVALSSRVHTILPPSDLEEIPAEQSGDRQERQKGGERGALLTLDTFLYHRGERYQKGISSPNSSWSSCSRLSPYLAWGHVSLRRVVQETKKRQAEIKAYRATGAPVSGINNWGRSLGAFLSRMHWRSHFIQKLEMEPLIEKRDMHPAYQPLRRQAGDWNPVYYEAWASGRTGFPFVDACMRCLHRHGWLNFRMRAMIVSFAVWNLWLDWKKIAPHLARCFLDFEPGIHYPQLQMQSGTTGINAMRVYNVTKQGKDQDTKGLFIRKYVPELRQVPNEHIHEPWKMPLQLQRKIKTRIASDVDDEEEGCLYYPTPIVDEKLTSKVAKDTVSAVRKKEETREIAGQVYQKHGSRKSSNDFVSGKAQSSSVKKKRVTTERQRSIKIFTTATSSSRNNMSVSNSNVSLPIVLDKNDMIASTDNDAAPEKELSAGKVIDLAVTDVGATSVTWTCKVCTYQNDKPYAPVCEMCLTQR